jgi:methionyl-tRNA synthetase
MLFDVAEAVRVAAVLLLPIIPASAREILRRVGEPGDPALLRLDRDGAWRAAGSRTVVKGEALWPRLEAAPASPTGTERATMSDSQVPPPATPAPQPPAPAAPAAAAPADAVADARIGFDDFMKVDLRVAKVLAAERVPKSKKLLKLSVDLGTEVRTIVAGLAEAYEPDALVGRSIGVVANLKPATLMGIESNGMVLAGSAEGGKPELVAFVDPPPPGSRIR